MKNPRWNPFRPIKEWGSRARKEEEHYRSRLTADRAVIGEQMNDFVADEEQMDQWEELLHVFGEVCGDSACLICYPAITKSGKVLTEDDFRALADEAEVGYDPSTLTAIPPLGDCYECGRPVFPKRGEIHGRAGAVHYRCIT